MFARSILIRIVALTLLTPSFFMVSETLALPEAEAAEGWPAEACTENSTRTQPTSSGQHECIANYWAHTNRGRLWKRIEPERAENQEEIYPYSEGVAEYVAQGRLIAKLSKGDRSFVSPKFQWETSMPDSGKRLDVMQYDPDLSSGTLASVFHGVVA